jgi:hypothetical protein
MYVHNSQFNFLIFFLLYIKRNTKSKTKTRKKKSKGLFRKNSFKAKDELL